eukprot:649364-Hanusia_phi.AAC.2
MCSGVILLEVVETFDVAESEGHRVRPLSFSSLLAREHVDAGEHGRKRVGGDDNDKCSHSSRALSHTSAEGAGVSTSLQLNYRALANKLE